MANLGFDQNKEVNRVLSSAPYSRFGLDNELIKLGDDYVHLEKSPRYVCALGVA